MATAALRVLTRTKKRIAGTMVDSSRSGMPRRATARSKGIRDGRGRPGRGGRGPRARASNPPADRRPSRPLRTTHPNSVGGPSARRASPRGSVDAPAGRPVTAPLSGRSGVPSPRRSGGRARSGQMGTTATVGVGVIGTGFGRRVVAPVSPRPRVRGRRRRVAAGREAWRAPVARADVDLVSVHSPPFLPRRHVVAARRGGQGRVVRQAVRLQRGRCASRWKRLP